MTSAHIADNILFEKPVITSLRSVSKSVPKFGSDTSVVGVLFSKVCKHIELINVVVLLIRALIGT